MPFNFRSLTMTFTFSLLKVSILRQCQELGLRSLHKKRFRRVFCAKAEGRVLRFLAARRLGQAKSLALRFAQETLRKCLLRRIYRLQ